jgi:hypothetical protein
MTDFHIQKWSLRIIGRGEELSRASAGSIWHREAAAGDRRRTANCRDWHEFPPFILHSAFILLPWPGLASCLHPRADQVRRPNRLRRTRPKARPDRATAIGALPGLARITELVGTHLTNPRLVGRASSRAAIHQSTKARQEPRPTRKAFMRWLLTTKYTNHTKHGTETSFAPGQFVPVCALRMRLSFVSFCVFRGSNSRFRD